MRGPRRSVGARSPIWRDTMMNHRRTVQSVNRVPRSERKKLGLLGWGQLRFRSRSYSRSFFCVVEWIGTNRDLLNLACRTVSNPCRRSTSLQSNPMASPTRIPVTANKPNRVALLTAGRFPGVEAFKAGAAERLVELAAPPAGSAAVVMTHHYVFDVPVLARLLPRPLAFVGLLGPRRRADRIVDDLVLGGLALTDAMRARLHAPVGLDLGAEGPEQVAVSIVSDILRVVSGRSGQPLRDRTRPIHSG